MLRAYLIKGQAGKVKRAALTLRRLGGTHCGTKLHHCLVKVTRSTRVNRHIGQLPVGEHLDKHEIFTSLCYYKIYDC